MADDLATEGAQVSQQHTEACISVYRTVFFPYVNELMQTLD